MGLTVHRVAAPLSFSRKGEMCEGVSRFGSEPLRLGTLRKKKIAPLKTQSLLV